MPPLTKAEREKRRLEEEYARQSQQQQRPTKTAPGGCRLHPEWVVDISAGQIPPSHPEGMCPFCRDSALERRDLDSGSREIRSKPKAGVGLNGDPLDSHYRDFLDRHPEIEERGSGSFFERDALLAIENARLEEEDRESRREPSLGKLVAGRIENGRWTEWRLSPGRREIVKVVL